MILLFPLLGLLGGVGVHSLTGSVGVAVAGTAFGLGVKSFAAAGFIGGCAAACAADERPVVEITKTAPSTRIELVFADAIIRRQRALMVEFLAECRSRGA